MRTKIVLIVVLLAVWAASLPAQEPTRSSDKDLTGILGALPDEVEAIEKQMTHKEARTIRGIRFVAGQLRDRPVVLAPSGIGKVNAAMAITLLLERYQPARVLFTGTSGGINPELGIGDIVIGAKSAQHDYGTMSAKGFQFDPTWHPTTTKNNPVCFPGDPKLLAHAQRAGAGLKLEPFTTSQGVRTPRVVTGIVVTGDMFVASAPKRDELRKNFHADAVEMEGAAVAQICFQQEVPCLIIRSLSDTADHRATEDFRTFTKTASENSALLIAAIVERLDAK